MTSVKKIEEFNWQQPDAQEKWLTQNCLEDNTFRNDIMDWDQEHKIPMLSLGLLAQLLRDGYTQEQIGKRFHISQATVSRRVADAYTKGTINHDEFIASDPFFRHFDADEVDPAITDQLWAIKKGCEYNFNRTLAAYHSCTRPSDRIRAAAEIRRQIEGARAAAEILYNADRVNRFIQIVTGAFLAYDENVQEKIAKALKLCSPDAAALASNLESPQASETLVDQKAETVNE